jgi:HAE1 family hydrophobic/amphiphilic exporter-1
LIRRQFVSPLVINHQGQFPSVTISYNLPPGTSLGEAVAFVWRARRSPNERRFQLTDMSVALLRNEAPVEVKITFAGHVSAFGWRPAGEPKLIMEVEAWAAGILPVDSTTGVPAA